MKPKSLWVWEGDGIWEVGNFREEIGVQDAINGDQKKLGGSVVCLSGCFMGIYRVFKGRVFLARGFCFAF